MSCYHSLNQNEEYTYFNDECSLAAFAMRSSHRGIPFCKENERNKLVALPYYVFSKKQPEFYKESERYETNFRCCSILHSCCHFYNKNFICRKFNFCVHSYITLEKIETFSQDKIDLMLLHFSHVYHDSARFIIHNARQHNQNRQ